MLEKKYKYAMKNLSYLFSILIFIYFSININASRSIEKPTLESVLPFEIELMGISKKLKDVQHSFPSIKLLIKKDSIEITVGQTEKYYTLFDSTEFTKLIPYLTLDDFKSNNYYLNPHLPGRIIKLRKEHQGETYTKTISSFKRGDIKVDYLEMDSIEIFKSYHLSRIANEVAIPFIEDNVNMREMITAKSMQEALKNPEKVYKLSLRNTRTKHLSHNIKKLTNLRVLDISGSFITEIPSEIEECKHLKSILANASKLSIIPPSIGNLKKLRVLNFAYCNIKSIPDEVGNITSLWSLSLDSNDLTKLPESFSNLKNLTTFSIAKNKFSEFPKSIIGMDSVGNLWIHGNKIKIIPQEISTMKGLHHFLLTESEIKNLEDIKQLIPDVRIINQK